MKNSLVWLIVIMVCGVSAALIASCENSSGSPYVPEVQKDDEPSGIGYARKLFPGKGDVLFTVSRQSSGTETLAIRACGKVEALGFCDGQALFQALEEEKPQLITLDIMLPGTDGIEILKKLLKFHHQQRLLHNVLHSFYILYF